MPRCSAFFVVLGLAAASGLAQAQSPDTFTARLSAVPISVAQLSQAGGEAEATATLSRSRLSVTGLFEGLPAPATAARVHRGAATGVSGPAIAELDIAPARDGAFEGTVELNREQREALLAGHLYLQIHAALGVPPDNAVLRGWLLAPRAPSTRRPAR